MGHNKNASVLRGRFKCAICQKGYMMEWAKNNHEKICRERDKKNRYNMLGQKEIVA